MPILPGRRDHDSLPIRGDRRAPRDGARGWLVALCAVGLASALGTSVAHADRGSVELRNGGRVRGEIVVVDPLERVVVLVEGTGSMTIPWADVDTVIDGERTYIAKSFLRTVRPLNLPPPPSLGTGRAASDSDPYAVLGIAPGAGKDEVRRAYLHLAKTYHPDRYATSDLPAEVRDYLSAMARRINAAHDAVEAAMHRQAAQEPVFTSPGRT